MTSDDDEPKDLLEENRKAHIEELKRQAKEITGEDMKGWEAEDIPSEVSEQFWEKIVDYESAGCTTHFQQLQDAGVEMLAPDAMDDQTLKAKLWEVIEKLASIRVFMDSTNHLSDRELYTRLWDDVLREEVVDMPFDQYSSWNIDLLGTGSEEDTYLQMKYYADEEWRKQWLSDFPDYEMPDHEDPPYNRDALLPGLSYEAPDNQPETLM